MDGPPLSEGGVVIAGGKIVGVGRGSDLALQFPDARQRHLGYSLILPGLVNAHAHLELTLVPRPPPPGTFVEWLVHVIENGLPSDPPAAAELAATAAVTGAWQGLKHGVTCVGDVTAFPSATRQALATNPLHVVSYGEVRAMAERRGLLDERLAAAVDPSHAGPRLHTGISPHAPYSVEADGYARCLAAARKDGQPLATHLAETPDERAFLADHAGPFRELWDRLGAWDEQVPRFDGGPVRFAHSLGLLDYPALLAHVNYCDDEELGLLAAGRASVVYCPRTHAYFRHPPHRWREMLARGINVAVGTDSCASSPDLNLVDDLRLMHRLTPDADPLLLWEMATARAARAVGMEAEVGTIAPGKAADFTVFSVQSSDPLREVLKPDLLPLQVWVGGERVI